MTGSHQEQEPAPGQVGASLGIGALTGCLVAAAALVLGIVPWHDLGPALVTVLVVVGLAYCYLGSLSTNALGERGRMAAALALVGFAPVLGHAAQRTLTTPLLTLPVRGAAEATSGILVALICLSTAGAAAWWWATRRRAPRGRLIHGAALGAVMACGALVAGAVVDARTSPSPEDYTSSLPVVATLAGEAPVARFSEIRPGPEQVGSSSFALGRTCVAGRCFVHVRRGERVRGFGPRVDQSSELLLRHDEEAGRILLVADGLAIATASSALDRWGWAAPTPTAIAAQVSPPRSFIALAMVALLGAVAALAWRRRLSERLAVAVSGRSGVVDAFGWVHLDDGTPPRRVTDEQLRGPVVLLGAAGSSTAYRGEGDAQSFALYRGPRRAVIARLRLAVATADAAICGWVLALSAPLAVAFSLGLLV